MMAFLSVSALILGFVLLIAGYFISPEADDTHPTRNRIVSTLCYVVGLLFLFLAPLFASVTFVDSKNIGIMDKKFGGGPLQNGRIMATNGENGIQANVLRDGLHWWKFAWQYDITQVPLTRIGEGKIGIIEVGDGRPMPSDRVYAPEWAPSEVTSMIDGMIFLTAAPNQKDDPATGNVDESFLPRGYKGPQLTVLGPGEYPINTELYQVTSVPMTEIAKGEVGVIKSNASEIPSTLASLYTPAYVQQAEDAFARRYIQKERARIRRELEREAGIDIYAVRDEQSVPTLEETLSPTIGEELVDAELAAQGITLNNAPRRPSGTVAPGEIGVWGIPLPPGKYWIHPRAFEVTRVNIRKQQIDFIGETTSGPEAETSAVYAKALDGFKFYVDNTVLYHIEPLDAPGVVAEVGDPDQLRSIVIAQNRKVLRDKIGEANTLQYVNDRVNQQKIATVALAATMEPYYVTVDDVNIRDMYEDQLDALLDTQSDREIAKEQEITYDQQRQAALKQQELNKAQQEAEEEKTLAMAAYEAKREEERKKQAITQAEARAQQVTIEAQAQAEKVRIEAEAEAAAIAMKGEAEAGRYADIVAALGQNNVTTIEVVDRIQDQIGRIKLPETFVLGGSGNGTHEGLMALFLRTMAQRDNADDQRPQPAISATP